MNKDEVLDLALDWLVCYKDKSMSRNNAEDLAEELITAIKQARSAPVQEPVAWRYDLKQTGSFAGVSTEYSPVKLSIGENWTPLYTTPPAAPVQEPAIKQGWDVDTLLDKPAAPVQELIGYLFQHEETGLTTVVDVQQVEWGFEKNNPRHQKIGPVYTTPPAAQLATEFLRLTKDGIWANPDIPADDAAKLVLEAIDHNIKILVQKAVLAEREACAKVCEEAEIVQTTYCMTLHDEGAETLRKAAAAIRARSCPPCNSDCDQGRNCPARKDK
jgi:hypothetical protein